MKKLSIPVVLLLLALLVGALPAGAITWGEPDTTHLNVGAMVVDWPGYGPYQWCTGTRMPLLGRAITSAGRSSAYARLSTHFSMPPLSFIRGGMR